MAQPTTVGEQIEGPGGVGDEADGEVNVDHGFEPRARFDPRVGTRDRVVAPRHSDSLSVYAHPDRTRGLHCT